MIVQSSPLNCFSELYTGHIPDVQQVGYIVTRFYIVGQFKIIVDICTIKPSRVAVIYHLLSVSKYLLSTHT